MTAIVEIGSHCPLTDRDAVLSPDGEERHGKGPEGEETADKSEEDPVIASKGGSTILIH